MRHTGVVNSFGNFSKAQDEYLDYGYIISGKKAVFVHKNHLLCEQKYMKPGELVSFEISNVNNKIEADKVILLKDETDKECISKFFMNNNWGVIKKSVYFKMLFDYLLNLAKLSKRDFENLVCAKLKELTIEDQKKFLMELQEKKLTTYRIMNEFISKKSLIQYLIIKEKSIRLDNDVDYVGEFKKTILRFDKNTKIWDEIPPHILLEKRIWDITPLSVKITALNKHNKINPENFAQSIKKVIEILQTLSINERSRLYNSLSIDFKLDKRVYDLIPAIDKLRILSNEKYYCNMFDDALIEAFVDISEDDKNKTIEILPFSLKANENIFKYLSSEEKVNVIANNNNLLKTLWRELDIFTKIMYLYRGLQVKENVVPLKDVENNKLVIAIIELISSPSYSNFRKMHNIFQDMIIENAWNPNYTFANNSLLPKCAAFKTTYCEAKPWGDTKVFCPRTYNNCIEYDFSNYGQYNYFEPISVARIKPDLKLNWKDWSLLELLAILNVTPILPELKNADEYTNKLSGWINRIIEVRDRMKCSVCGKTMIPNMKYSRNIAVYNSTIFSCSEGSGHDKNIYITHCWACHRIIDSRESKIRDHKGLFICINCGSGNRNSLYRQGSICPNCGDEPMICIDGSRYYSCKKCSHEIKIPPVHLLTGRDSVTQNENLAWIK